MITREQVLKNLKYEEEILELIDHREDYTRGDLQGRVEAIVLEIQRDNK